VLEGKGVKREKVSGAFSRRYVFQGFSVLPGCFLRRGLSGSMYPISKTIETTYRKGGSNFPMTCIWLRTLASPSFFPTTRCRKRALTPLTAFPTSPEISGQSTWLGISNIICTASPNHHKFVSGRPHFC
jgi:hypothetical protein